MRYSGPARFVRVGYFSTVFFRVIENPVESISFTPAKPFEIMENSNGYYEDGWVWNDETEEEEEDDYFTTAAEKMKKPGTKNGST